MQWQCTAVMKPMIHSIGIAPWVDRAKKKGGTIDTFWSHKKNTVDRKDHRISDVFICSSLRKCSCAKRGCRLLWNSVATRTTLWVSWWKFRVIRYDKGGEQNTIRSIQNSIWCLFKLLSANVTWNVTFASSFSFFLRLMVVHVSLMVLRGMDDVAGIPQ